jgi:hypothetical protein
MAACTRGLLRLSYLSSRLVALLLALCCSCVCSIVDSHLVLYDAAVRCCLLQAASLAVAAQAGVLYNWSACSRLGLIVACVNINVVWLVVRGYARPSALQCLGSMG